MSAPRNFTHALSWAFRALRDGGIDDPASDARWLLAHSADVARDGLALYSDDRLPAGAFGRLQSVVARRIAHEPVSIIIGHKAFWGRDFIVNRHVLSPRPETESLIAAALETPFARVLDLGTGSGAILLTLLAERPQVAGVGADLSEPALQVAARNAAALGQADRATLVASNWFDQIAGRFDLIVANPPYIARSEMSGLAPELGHEPRIALTDEDDGLSAHRAIAAGAPAHLAPGGQLLVEIGPTQAGAVSGLFAQVGLTRIDVLPDLDGRDRIVRAWASMAP